MTLRREQPKRKRGRPVKKPLPERIPDSPENVLKAVLATPPTPRDGWRYQREAATR